MNEVDIMDEVNRLDGGHVGEGIEWRVAGWKRMIPKWIRWIQ